jgi:hypothetical protein
MHACIHTYTIIRGKLNNNQYVPKFTVIGQNHPPNGWFLGFTTSQSQRIAAKTLTISRPISRYFPRTSEKLVLAAAAEELLRAPPRQARGLE